MTRTSSPEVVLNCPACETGCRRFGKHRNGLRRFRCTECGKTYTEPHKTLVDGSYIPKDRVVMALHLLIEGNSLRSTQRITGLDINTLMKLLVKAGEKCERLMGRVVCNVKVQDVECDEVWSYIGKKDKRVQPDDDQTLGDAYVFVGIERNSKLVLNVAMGKRDQVTTNAFIDLGNHPKPAIHNHLKTGQR